MEQRATLRQENRSLSEAKASAVKEKASAKADSLKQTASAKRAAFSTVYTGCTRVPSITLFGSSQAG